MVRAARVKKAVGKKAVGGAEFLSNAKRTKKQTTRENVNPTGPAAGGDNNGGGIASARKTTSNDTADENENEIEELRKEIATMKG